MKNHVINSILCGFVCVCVFVLNSCNQTEVYPIHELKHQIVNDSTSHPDIYFERGAEGNKMIDIKVFNDTIFLFVIPDTEDTVRFLTFYWDDGFKYLKTHYLPDEQSRVFNKSGYYSLAVISPDSIVIAGDEHISIYCIKNNTFSEFTWQTHEYFQSQRSPIQWHNGTKKIFSEYWDFSKPENEMGVLQSELFAGIDIENKSLIKIPILPPENKNVLTFNSTYHITLTNSGLLCKHSILNEFIFYDFKKEQTSVFEIPALNNLIDTHEESDLSSFDLLRNDFMKSYIQRGLSHDSYTNNTILFYLEPVPERDKDGNKPSPFYRGKLCYVFDSEMNIKGKIRLEADTFYPSLFFAIKNNIYLVEVRNTFINIKKISYES